MADGFLAPAPAWTHHAATSGLVAVVNAHATRAGRENRRRWIAALKERFGLTDADVLEAAGPSLRAALREAALRRPRAVAAFGGDGTMRTALEMLTPRGVPLAPLPGGTLNRLTAHVHGGRSVAAVLASIEAGAPRWIPGGVVGAKRFFVASGFGAPMRLNIVRERLRGAGLAAALRAWRAASAGLFAEPLRLGEGGRRATLALVGVGPLDAAFGLTRPAPRASFETASALWRGWPAPLAIAPRALLGGWRRDPAVVVARTRTLTLHGGEALPALLDGEPETFAGSITLRFEDEAGLVWAA